MARQEASSEGRELHISARSLQPRFTDIIQESARSLQFTISRPDILNYLTRFVSTRLEKSLSISHLEESVGEI